MSSEPPHQHACQDDGRQMPPQRRSAGGSFRTLSSIFLSDAFSIIPAFWTIGRNRENERDKVASFSFDTFTGIALRRSGILFQHLWGVLGPPEAQLIHTLSKFHFLLHEIYLTDHHSSHEHAIYGISCLLLPFLNLTTCHLSNLRSMNLIWSLSSLNLPLLFSFVLGWGFA